MRVSDENYYWGRGADPSVRYILELEHPDQARRRLEWHGIVAALEKQSITARTLGLNCQCAEDGWIAERTLREYGIPIMPRADLEHRVECYDLITAVEAIEHIPDHLAFLALVRSC